MTQKLKISIRETKRELFPLTENCAAEILYYEHILHKIHPFAELHGYIPNSIEMSEFGWSMRSKVESIRPATDEEIKAWHRLQIGKFLSNELYRDKDDVNILKDKEIILELIDECPSTITQTAPKTDDDNDDGDQIYVSIDENGNAWCGV